MAEEQAPGANDIRQRVAEVLERPEIQEMNRRGAALAAQMDPQLLALFKRVVLDSRTPSKYPDLDPAAAIMRAGFVAEIDELGPNADAYCGLAQSYYYEGDHAEAARNFKLALTQQDRNPQHPTGIGRSIYETYHQSDEGLAAYHEFFCNDVKAMCLLATWLEVSSAFKCLFEVSKDLLANDQEMALPFLAKCAEHEGNSARSSPGYTPAIERQFFYHSICEGQAPERARQLCTLARANPREFCQLLEKQTKTVEDIVLYRALHAELSEGKFCERATEILTSHMAKNQDTAVEELIVVQYK